MRSYLKLMQCQQNVKFRKYNFIKRSVEVFNLIVTYLTKFNCGIVNQI
jgi:hypothetical protein